MKTLSFIGSDKNAGKTTALNFVYQFLRKKDLSKICLTSIGINGEIVDQYDGRQKPSISIEKNDFFLTASEHLVKLTGLYKTVHSFTLPNYSKNYILAQATSRQDLILEGPNNKSETIEMKKILQHQFDMDLLLIDGSIDRQFLADPLISDSFNFALLVSDREEQRNKSIDLLTPLNFERCRDEDFQIIDNKIASGNRSALWNEQEILFSGDQIPFLDERLKKVLSENKDKSCTLYLNGALCKSLYTFLASFDKLKIVLNNFTLYQNISTIRNVDLTFKPTISLLHPIKVDNIFIKEEDHSKIKLPIPNNIPIHNIFKEEINALRI